MGYNARNTHGGVSYILKAALSGNNGCKTKNTHKGCFLFWRRHPESDRG